MTASESHSPFHDPACDIAHGLIPAPMGGRRLVAVFASAVSLELVHFATHVGFDALTLEPDLRRQGDAVDFVADLTSAGSDENTDIVVTDHDRPELGDILAEALSAKSRWIGVMGSPRHTAPHIAALQERGFDAGNIARVHRPIGLDIGSHSPGEIAIATVAGLLADRNGRSGGPYVQRPV